MLHPMDVLMAVHLDQAFVLLLRHAFTSDAIH